MKIIHKKYKMTKAWWLMREKVNMVMINVSFSICKVVCFFMSSKPSSSSSPSPIHQTSLASFIPFNPHLSPNFTHPTPCWHVSREHPILLMFYQGCPQPKQQNHNTHWPHVVGNPLPVTRQTYRRSSTCGWDGLLNDRGELTSTTSGCPSWDYYKVKPIHPIFSLPSFPP